jgi:hypothetical protein
MKKLNFLIILLVFFSDIYARENVGQRPRTNTNGHTSPRLVPCAVPRSKTELNVNNVRAALLISGDMWWDGEGTGLYEVPKVAAGQQSVSSIFAGAVWIGGIDAVTGTLRAAAQTYRQAGANDYFAGPLDNSGETDQARCNLYDRFWEVSGDNIKKMINDFNDNQQIDEQIPDDILQWPGASNPNNPLASGFGELGPYFDRDGDGVYNPSFGDVPIIGACVPASIDEVISATPAQLIWWVYNDNGNIHTETEASPIGMEIQTTAFSFVGEPSEDINQMTFYRHRLINKGANTLDSTYMGQWVDPDLGWYADDFVGCDTVLGIGYVYNGDAIDDINGPGYGTALPMLAVDYFRGPKNEFGEELKMTNFLYYNNENGTSNGNPSGAQHYYNYLSGTWGNGSVWQWGGNSTSGGRRTNFMFPSPPDEVGAPATVWSECSSRNAPSDRRFLMSSGPFRLLPGADNDLVIGIPWVRPVTTCPSMALLRRADLSAQALFNECFKAFNPIDAPMSIKIENESNQAILQWNPIGDNLNNKYAEMKGKIPELDPETGLPNDRTYDFEGYAVFQIKNVQSAAEDFTNTDYYRMVFQCDVKNGIKDLYNFYPMKENPNLYSPKRMIVGSDNGIKTAALLTEDAFATGDNKKLINGKNYYYRILAYSTNNYRQFDPNKADYTQDLQFSGTLGTVITVQPHDTKNEFSGYVATSTFGQSVEITRLEGVGNSGLFVDLADETRNSIASSPTNILETLKYKAGSGPFVVYVVDPKNVKDANFKLTVIDQNPNDSILTLDSARWRVEVLGTTDTILSYFNIRQLNEQLLLKYGIAVALNSTNAPGSPATNPNGYIGAAIEYKGDEKDWLTGFKNKEYPLVSDILTTGTTQDPDDMYTNVLGGTWYPYTICNCTLTTQYQYITPAFQSNQCPQIRLQNKISKLRNVDIVFTPDKSKWSRTIVLESAPSTLPPSSGATPMTKSKHDSWNDLNAIDGNGNPIYDAADAVKGKSWFPGYAVDVITGERLEIFFAEDSYFGASGTDPNTTNGNGNDLLWNPNDVSVLANPFPGGQPDLSKFPLGGKHNVYVANYRYNEGRTLDSIISLTSTSQRRKFYENIIWASMPYLQSRKKMKSLSQGLVPGEAIVKLRVGTPANVYGTAEYDATINNHPKYTFSTVGLAPKVQLTDVAKSALDNINVVPNPYYAYSQYEQQTNDKAIRITNLPQNTVITIMSIDGTLIRQLRNEFANGYGIRSNPEATSDPLFALYDTGLGDANLDEATRSYLATASANFRTYVEWNMTNEAGIVVSSGTYLIHINAPGIGEKTVKWFGVMAPITINKF